MRASWEPVETRALEQESDRVMCRADGNVTDWGMLVACAAVIRRVCRCVDVSICEIVVGACSDELWAFNKYSFQFNSLVVTHYNIDRIGCLPVNWNSLRLSPVPLITFLCALGKATGWASGLQLVSPCHNIHSTSCLYHSLLIVDSNRIYSLVIDPTNATSLRTLQTGLMHMVLPSVIQHLVVRLIASIFRAWEPSASFYFLTWLILRLRGRGDSPPKCPLTPNELHDVILQNGEHFTVDLFIRVPHMECGQMFSAINTQVYAAFISWVELCLKRKKSDACDSSAKTIHVVCRGSL
jgi:hypothetical protein